jgi:hypothetical protein
MAEVFHEISSVARSMAESGQGRGAQAVRRLRIGCPRGRKITNVQIANAPFAAVTVCRNDTIHSIHLIRSCLAFLAGGLAFSIDARQSPELKRSALDRMLV